MVDIAFEPIRVRRTQLRDIAYDHIKEMIVSNRLAPGTLVTIDELVGRLAVSRTPVREALLRLQSEHLVDILPQRAVRVTEITPAEVRELFALRELLECAALEHASQTIPVAALDALDEQIVAAERQAEKGDHGLYVRSDLELHGLILLHSGNSLLAELLTVIHDRAKRVRIFSGVYHHGEYLAVVTAEHRALVDALRRRDTHTARDVLADHLRRSTQRILAQISSHSQTTGDGRTTSGRRAASATG